MCIRVTPSTKSTNSGSRYLLDGFSERDEIWQIEEDLLYVVTLIGELWYRESPLGAKILKSVKNCNTFLVHLFSECNEIWLG